MIVRPLHLSTMQGLMVDVLIDGRPHSTDELYNAIGGTQSVLTLYSHIRQLGLKIKKQGYELRRSVQCLGLGHHKAVYTLRRKIGDEN